MASTHAAIEEIMFDVGDVRHDATVMFDVGDVRNNANVYDDK